MDVAGENGIKLSSLSPHSILDDAVVLPPPSFVVDDAENKQQQQQPVNQTMITCLHKDESCFSADCEKLIECKEVNFSTHCYAIVAEIHNDNESRTDAAVESNETSVEAVNVRTGGARVRVVMAGCWSAGMECDPPVSINIKHKLKAHSHEKPPYDYKIPSSLLDDRIQNSCIGYKQRPGDTGHLSMKNQTFCCCRFNGCNKNIFLTEERNPFEMFSIELNPSTRSRTSSTSPTTRRASSSLLTSGEINAIIVTSLIFILLIILTIIGFLIYKRRKLLFKNKATHLPSVGYSKAGSSDDAFDMNSQLKAELNHHQQNNSSGDGHNIMLNEYLNNHLPNTSLTAQLIMNNEDTKPYTQPLLNNTKTSVYTSSIVAPNVQVMPSDALFIQQPGRMPAKQHLPPPILNQPINFAELMSELKVIECDQQNGGGLIMESGETGLDSTSQQPLLPPPSDLYTPSRLKSTDIGLIERISVGQFSTVWKGRCLAKSKCVNGEEVIDEPDYAVKVFGAHQKSSWANEKDIYNLLSTTNEFILRYYGSDINEKEQNSNQNKTTKASSFLPNGNILFNSLNANTEYWLITEYHPCGSLYDYLKSYRVSWPQMVRLTHSILEGLAYLHSEQCSEYGGKSFAIAHRDLKSKNILVKQNTQTCCIADFGLALKLNSSNKLSSSEIRSKVGTRRYMSPELIEGAIAFTKETFLRIDVYACALVLWEVISRGDFYEDEPNQYKLPFEDEVGQNPTLEEMKDVVVDKCQRPVIKKEWTKHHQISLIGQTIEECWDIDLDARISSECAASRIRKIYQNI